MPADPPPSAADDPKAPLRLQARTRRREAAMLLGPRIGPILAANFMQAFSLAPSQSVAGYRPVGAEANVEPLMAALAARGHPCALPAVAEADRPLVFRAWRPGDALARGAAGIPEPLPGTPELVPDVVLVPLLAFDAAGHRLGYGGGYYDRTLAALRARGRVLAIGIAFSAQGVDGLPGAEHDQRLDAVLTELGVTRFDGKAGA